MEALQREVEAWRARKPYEVFGEHNPGAPDEYVFRLRFFEPIPREWGLLVGDFAHNMRSALDHLAYQLVVAGGGTPSVRTQFPILVESSGWEGRQGRERLDGAATRHVEIVESLQPYHRTDLHGSRSVWGAMPDPLAVLAFLNNEDKDRALHATPVALSGIAWRVQPVRGIESFRLDEVRFNTRPLKDREYLLRVAIVASVGEPKARLDHGDGL